MHYRQIFKQFGVYSAGAIILKAMSAGSWMFLIHWISPAEFGQLALLNQLLFFLPIVLGLGLRQVLAIEYFGVNCPWTLIFQLSWIYIILSGPVTLILLWRAQNLNLWLFANQLPLGSLKMTILTGSLIFWSELLMQLWRFQNRAISLTLFQLSLGIVLIVGTWYFGYICQFGIIAIVQAQFLTYLLAAIGAWVAWWPQRTNFVWPSLSTIMHYLKIGLPFIPNLIFAWLIIACNRLMLNWHATITDVGIYSLAENISLLFQALVTQPLMHTYLPHLFQTFSQNQSSLIALDQRNTKIATYLIASMLIGLPVLYLVGRPILKICLPIKYLASLPLLIPLLFAQALWTASFLTSASLQYLKQTKYLAGAMASCAGLAILMNWWLLPYLGYYSCLIAINGAYLGYLWSIWGLKRWYFAKLAPALDTDLLHRQT